MDNGTRFKTTRWSLVIRAGGAPTPAARAALEELCQAYRAPLQAFARCLARRLGGDPEELLQGFFCERFVEKNMLSTADPARGRFRNLLRTSLRNYAHNLRDAENRKKRGGGASFVDANLVASEDPSADRLHDRLWARALLDRARARFADEETQAGKGALLDALHERLAGDDDAARPLREVAAGLGMSEVAVRVALFRLRRRLATLVREEVAETVERPEDVDAELRHLLAAWRDDS